MRKINFFVITKAEKFIFYYEIFKKFFSIITKGIKSNFLINTKEINTDKLST